MGGTRHLAAATMVLMLSPALLAAQSVSARLEAYLDAQVREEGFSGSVLVSFRGRSVLARGYGYANAEHAVANTTRTKFAIGSITKQFTAMAILILAERGRLHLDDTLGDHLPDVPDQWQDLTLHQLLTHTSGLMHSWALPGFRETMMIPAGLDETVERFREQPLLSRPG